MAIFGKFKSGGGSNIPYSPSQGLDFGNPTKAIIRAGLGVGSMYNGMNTTGTENDTARPGVGSVAGYVGSYNNAARFKPGINPVRQKFEGYVNFHFNSAIGVSSLNNNDTRNTLSSLCRTADVPSAEIQTDVKNQYNRKRITVTHTEFNPITVTAYDTIDSAWVVVLMKMYAHLFTQPINKFDTSGTEIIPKITPDDVVPQAIAGGGSEAVAKGNFDSNFAGYNLQPSKNRNFITSMDIVKFHGQKAIRYTVFNPLITSFVIDGIDHSDSQPAMITMNILYENFSINPKLNSWLSEEELQRFSGFNVGEWDRLRNGAVLEESVMSHGEMAERSIINNVNVSEKNLEFLNRQDVRSPQSKQFFEQFNSGNTNEQNQKPDKKQPPKEQRSNIGGTI